jgi:hypothetical protein
MRPARTSHHACRPFAGLRIFSLLALGALLAAAAEATIIRVELDFSPPSIQPNADGSVRVEAADCLTFNEPGFPLLPARKAVVLLPPGEEVLEVRVYPSAPQAIEGTYQVAPAETPRPISQSGPFPPTPADATVYSSDRLYPSGAARLVTEQIASGHGLAFLQVYPVAYRPLSGELVWYERVTIEVETALMPGADPTRIPLLRNTDRVERRLSRLVLNPEDLALYGGASAADLSDSRLDPGYYPYVIITSQALHDAFLPVVDFESSRGLRARIMLVTDIRAAYPSGRDVQESIRLFIIDAYNTWQTDFVLLGGDHDVVEERDLYVNAGGTVDNFPGDCYYEGLNGNWNNDGDSRWGEPGEEDLAGELAVGRVSANTATEVANWRHKNEMYTEQPVTAEVKKALFLGEQLDSQTYGDDSMEDVKIGNNHCGYTTTGYPTSYTRTTLYDRNGTWTKAQLIALMNAGFPTTHHLGHSNTTICMRLENSDMPSFTNDGVSHSYMFNYSQGCYAGDFDNTSTDCIVEKMVLDDNVSAAFIGCSRYGWYSPGSTCGPSQHFERQAVDACYAEGIKTAGYMNVDSKIDCIWMLDAWNRWCHYELCLHGDPAMPQWIDVYGTLAMSHSGTYQVGQGNYQVTVTAGGSPVNGATVTMYSDDLTVWVTGQTGANGVVQLNPGTVSPMTLHLKAIKADYLRATGDVTVVNQQCVIALTAPNGGQTYCPGDPVTITWSATSCGADVSLELLQGGSVCATIATSTPNDGSYPWTAAACGSYTTGHTIRVTDLASGTADASDASFTIQPAASVGVLVPNGGEHYLVGASVPINWSHSICSGADVRLELLQSGGLCATIAASTPNDGAHTWTAAQCGSFTTGYQVRVVDPTSGASDMSDGTFEIQPPCTIALTAPNGGQSFCPGEAVTIGWSASSCGANVRLELLRDGALCATIAVSTPNDGSFPWAAAPCGDFTTGYAVRVTDLDGGSTDVSDAPFTIRAACAVALLAPNGGGSFLPDEPVEITWSHGECCGPEVAIELLLDGTLCLTIAADTPNDGSFAWTATPCGASTEGYRIRVRDLATGAVDASDGDFSIRPSYLVTAIANLPDDQGGRVQIDWLRCWFDTGAGSPITAYAVYRRHDARSRPDGWDLVASVPAVGGPTYSTIAPTLCDSTIVDGMCGSVFFVRAVTADPLVFYDTPADSGYSVDELAPAPPTGLHLEGENTLLWNASTEEDLAHYTVYGSEAPELDSTAVTIGTTTDTTLVVGDLYLYYHLTATDHAGNEGEEATLYFAAGLIGTGPQPTRYALYQNSPNPGRPFTTIAFDLPRESRVVLRVFDLTGRRVATLADGRFPPGRHAVSWTGGAGPRSGAYFYRLDAERFSQTRKMLVVR